MERCPVCQKPVEPISDEKIAQLAEKYKDQIYRPGEEVELDTTKSLLRLELEQVLAEGNNGSS